MELNNKTKEYWADNDLEDVKKVNSIPELYQIAVRVIERMPKPFVQVCGPIGTGGVGSVAGNLEMFNKTIVSLQEKGLNVFDQMPFEEPIQKIKEKTVKDGEYFESVLTDFYLPLFESRLISHFYFMPDWESSRGARWEHEKAKELGIEIIYL